MVESNEDLDDAKRALRASMRSMRRALPDREHRSALIVERLLAIPALTASHRVLAYDAVVGEVDPAAAVGQLRVNGAEVRMPEDDVDPTWPDTIIVPGTAFTIDGRRLGQGGGWYDRFLAGRRADAITIGIGFAPQLIEFVPVGRHDVVLDCVVTEDGPIWRDG